MKRWLVFLLAVTILGGLASAQRVNVLCSPDLAWCEALGPAFGEATGGELEFIRVSSQDALARIRAEAANPVFDVWFGGTGDPHLIAAREGLTEFYRPSVWEDLLPSLREAVADEYIPLYAGALGFVVNEQVVEEQGLTVPTSWRDLADPQYRGLIAMPDPNSSGTGYTIIATLVQIFGEDEAFELLADIHQNIAQYTSSGSAPGQLAGRGEVAVAIQFMHDGVKFAQQGFPLLVLAPEEGTGYEIGGISLLAGAPNREAAIAFIEWALTPEAQAIAAEQGDSYQVQTNMGTPVSPLAPDLDSINLIDYDFDRFGTLEVRDALVARWTNEIFPTPR
ncbi:MAG: ABC transporter substrate-binding protein [Deinococcota bacterium]|jgi:iron(III) transport system substrate-binding protein|nr:ABC transporter substrate-binding protein [Deinococcota bacterium]